MTKKSYFDDDFGSPEVILFKTLLHFYHCRGAPPSTDQKFNIFTIAIKVGQAQSLQGTYRG